MRTKVCYDDTMLFFPKWNHQQNRNILLSHLSICRWTHVSTDCLFTYCPLTCPVHLISSVNSELLNTEQIQPRHVCMSRVTGIKEERCTKPLWNMLEAQCMEDGRRMKVAVGVMYWFLCDMNQPPHTPLTLKLGSMYNMTSCQHFWEKK